MYKRMSVLLVLLFFLVSCSSSYRGETGNQDSPNLPSSTALSSVNRKIIYKVEGTFHVTDHVAFTNEIKAALLSDEWIDYESLSSGRSSLVLRIKTDRLEAFLVDLQASHTFTSYAKTATDISLSYTDKTLMVDALMAQRARLIALYEDASFSETLQLNQEIAKVDLELAKVQGELNTFDSLIEYSEVIITIYKTSITAPSHFGEEAKEAFYDGIYAIVFIVRHTTLLLIRVFPIGVIAFGSAFGVSKLSKRRKQRKKGNQFPIEKE